MRKKIVMLMLLACMITQNTVYADVLENQEHTTTDANTSVKSHTTKVACFHTCFSRVWTRCLMIQ